MVLMIALMNDGTVLTISLDRVLPSMEPDHWVRDPTPPLDLG